MNKKERENLKKIIFWPIRLLALLIVSLNLLLPSYAEDSSYYDVSDSSRPPSVFSICCCNKENDDGFQVVYSCKYVEEPKCPENSKQYKAVTGDCPSNLMFTKYSPEQNKDSGN